MDLFYPSDLVTNRLKQSWGNNCPRLTVSRWLRLLQQLQRRRKQWSTAGKRQKRYSSSGLWSFICGSLEDLEVPASIFRGTIDIYTLHFWTFEGAPASTQQLFVRLAHRSLSTLNHNSPRQDPAQGQKGCFGDVYPDVPNGACCVQTWFLDDARRILANYW